MKKRKMFSICFLISLGIGVCMIIHWINLSKKQSHIEKLAFVLKDVKTMIPESAVISFQTNLKEESQVTELYFQTQFVMTPAIVSKVMDRDTILAVESILEEPLKDQHVDILKTITGDEVRVTLLRKK